MFPFAGITFDGEDKVAGVALKAMPIGRLVLLKIVPVIRLRSAGITGVDTVATGTEVVTTGPAIGVDGGN
jgi:hypothetical protein